MYMAHEFDMGTDWNVITFMFYAFLHPRFGYQIANEMMHLQFLHNTINAVWILGLQSNSFEIFALFRGNHCFSSVLFFPHFYAADAHMPHYLTTHIVFVIETRYWLKNSLIMMHRPNYATLFRQQNKSTVLKTINKTCSIFIYSFFLLFCSQKTFFIPFLDVNTSMETPICIEVIEIHVDDWNFFVKYKNKFSHNFLPSTKMCVWNTQNWFHIHESTGNRMVLCHHVQWIKPVLICFYFLL